MCNFAVDEFPTFFREFIVFVFVTRVCWMKNTSSVNVNMPSAPMLSVHSISIFFMTDFVCNDCHELREILACLGGNAGLATSYAGMLLGLPVHVFVPSTTPESVIALFKQYEGSTVTVYGKVCMKQ